MSLATTTYIRCRLHRNDGGTDQYLEIRMGRLRRLISRRPFDGIPYKIRTESSLFSLGNATLPLPLRKLQDPLFCHSYIASFLSHFKFSAVASDQIARNITSSVVELLAGGNYDAKFCLVAEINHIRLFWPENEENRNGEDPASKRLKKEEFEDGDCSVCLQELKDEVCRILK